MEVLRIETNKGILIVNAEHYSRFENKYSAYLETEDNTLYCGKVITNDLDTAIDYFKNRI